jgi:hypothetical protein
MGPQRTSIPRHHSGTVPAPANTHYPDSEVTPANPDFTRLFDDIGRLGLPDQIGVIADKAVSTAEHIHAGPGPISFSEKQGSE